MKRILASFFKVIPFILVVDILISLFVIPTITFSKVVSKNIGDGTIAYFLNVFMENNTKPLTLLGELANMNLLPKYFADVEVLMAISFIFAMYLIFKSPSKEEWEGKEHGSSDWADGNEQYKILSRTNGIVLAKKHYLPLDKKGNTNVLVVGGSGAGKSTSYVLPNAKNLLGSYVFTDPKGELYDTTAEYFRQNGYEIKLLNLVDPKHSDGFNPLLNISNQLDVDVISSIIFKQENGASPSDPFWNDVGTMLLKSFIYYLLFTGNEKEINLANCSNLVRLAGDNPKTSIYSELINNLSEDNLARKFYESAASGSEKTFQSVLITLQSKLGKFDSPDIADLTSTNTIDLARIGKVKTVLYVRGSDTHSAYDFLLTIFFAQLINKIYEEADLCGGKLKIPLIFMLDEFSNIGRIPDFERTISTSRSRGISFSLILQDLEQLKSLYEKSYTTIMGNCDTHLFLGTNTQETLEYFSKALGEKTIKFETSSYSKSTEKANKTFSEQKSARVLLTPDELRRMSLDQCIIFEKGIKPILATKIKSYTDPEYSILYKNMANHLEYTVERGTWSPIRLNSLNNGMNINTDLDLSKLFNPEVESVSSSNSSSNNTESASSTDDSKNIDDEKDKIIDIDIYKKIEDKFDTLMDILD